MVKKLSVLALLAALAVAPLAAEDSWVSVGPWGGSVASVVVHPRNPRILYAGSSGGVFKSTDGGLSWEDVHGELPARFVPVLAVSPSAPDTLYAGVGIFTDSWGVYHSNDGGASWKSWTSGFDDPDCGCDVPQVFALAVHPRDPKTVLAGASSGIYRTTDGGLKWTRLTARSAIDSALALAFDPARPSTVYAGTPNGIFKSTNGGSSWAEATMGLGQRFVYALALDPGKSGVLYAGTDTGVFKSTDAAGRWTPASAGLSDLRVLSLAISPAAGGAARTLWAGTETGAFRSRNGAVSWSRASVGLRNRRIAALAVHPANPRLLWAASGSAQGYQPGPGLFRSVNGGDRWRISNRGLSATSMTSIAVDPQTPGVLWASEFRNGVWRSADGGVTWTERNRGLGELNIADLAIDPDDSDSVWAGTSRGLYRTMDGGATWELSSSGLVDPDTSELLPVTRVLPAPGRLWIGTSRGLFHSEDEGTTWTLAPVPSIPEIIVVDVVLHPEDPDFLLLSPTLWGALTGGPIRSVDGGLTWTPATDIPNGFPVLTSFAWDPLHPERVFAGASRSWLGVSEDFGQSWTPLATPSFSGTVYALAVDPVDGSVWAGALGSGLHHLNQDGTPRTPDPSLDLLSVLELEFDPHDPRVLHAATSRGIFKRVPED